MSERNLAQVSIENVALYSGERRWQWTNTRLLWPPASIARQQCWPPAILFYRCSSNLFFFFSPPNLWGRLAVTYYIVSSSELVAELKLNVFSAVCFRYKKRLKKLLIVHPTFFLRTIVLMTRPFIRFVYTYITSVVCQAVLRVRFHNKYIKSIIQQYGVFWR